MMHDLGKYSDKFQRRIRGEDIKVDHATAGARVCLELGGMYPFMEYCIAGHHAGLPDAGGKSDAVNSPTLNGRRKKNFVTIRVYGCISTVAKIVNNLSQLLHILWVADMMKV